MPGTKRFQFVIETLEPGKWELSGYEAALPITVKSTLTQDMNKADAEQIVRLLGQCDAEIFQEEGQVMPTYQLYNESTLTTMEQVAEKVQKMLKEPGVGWEAVVLSEGVTSGRMAFLMSVSFNQLMKGLGQIYLVAGGDRSVMASREGTEDSALDRIEELKKVAAGKKRVIVIGVLVGLCSLCAGQMDYCVDNPDVFLPVLVGFNPLSMARNDPIEDSSTFQIVEQMQKLQEKQEAFVLNPAVGILLGVIITPQSEGLSDSFWMKGRNATNILLEALLPAAHKTVDHFLEILQTFEQAYQVTYGSPKIATLMKQASTRCVDKGQVYLVGWQTLGIIAITDGVECMHAFASHSSLPDFWDVHEFLIADRSGMFNQEAELINQGPHFSFSQEDFLTPILPSLTETDTVLFIFTLDDNLTEVQTLVQQVKEKTSNIQHQALAHSTVGQSLSIPLKKLFPSIISITWPLLFFEYQGNFIQKFHHELSTKWVLNTVSTGAHVLFGQILQNHMLDLLIHNFRLFWALAILQVIHFPQPLLDDMQEAPIFHVQVAHEKEHVIPIALLSLLFQCSSAPSPRPRHIGCSSVCGAVRSALSGPSRKRKADPLESLKPALP
ncbi:LOW QUALITY PROTEIN: glucokinase regulatory protein [Dama dama]